VFDPKAKQPVFTASSEPKAPAVETFFDQKTGLKVKGVWNPLTKQWDMLPGQKAPSGGTSFTVDKDGTISFTQGGPGGGKPLRHPASPDDRDAEDAPGNPPTASRRWQRRLAACEAWYERLTTPAEQLAWSGRPASDGRGGQGRGRLIDRGGHGSADQACAAYCAARRVLACLRTRSATPRRASGARPGAERRPLR